MEHYSDGVWDRLPTTVTSENDEDIYFEAITTGFSPFIICADIIAENMTNENMTNENMTDENMTDEVPDADIPLAENYVPIVTDENVQETSKNDSTKAVLLFASMLVGVFGFMYYRKRSKGKI